MSWEFEFDERIIDMVWRIFSNNWCSILVNGQAYGFFRSSRGGKQRDPLSPILFVISAEVMSRNLNSLFHEKEYI